MEFCFNVPEDLGAGDGSVPKHIVGFEPILNTSTKKYIHHYTLYGYGDSSVSPPTYGTCPVQWWDCYPPAYIPKASENMCTDNKRELMWLWAPGLSGSKLPDEAGIRILGTGLKAFILQVHYDNPNDDAGMVDSSGFRIYYTSTLRANDAGVLEIGDPQVTAGPQFTYFTGTKVLAY
jgi:dopamine beta-monooxygenase